MTLEEKIYLHIVNYMIKKLEDNPSFDFSRHYYGSYLIETVKNKKYIIHLDVNSNEYLEDYDEVLDKYGKDIADMYDNTPNDPQSDYQYKCYIHNMTLIGYDEKGNKYTANI